MKMTEGEKERQKVRERRKEVDGIIIFVSV